MSPAIMIDASNDFPAIVRLDADEQEFFPLHGVSSRAGIFDGESINEKLQITWRKSDVILRNFGIVNSVG